MRSRCEYCDVWRFIQIYFTTDNVSKDCNIHMRTAAAAVCALWRIAVMTMHVIIIYFFRCHNLICDQRNVAKRSTQWNPADNTLYIDNRLSLMMQFVAIKYFPKFV